MHCLKADINYVSLDCRSPCALPEYHEQGYLCMIVTTVVNSV